MFIARISSRKINDNIVKSSRGACKIRLQNKICKMKKKVLKLNNVMSESYVKFSMSKYRSACKLFLLSHYFVNMYASETGKVWPILLSDSSYINDE